MEIIFRSTYNWSDELLARRRRQIKHLQRCRITGFIRILRVANKPIPLAIYEFKWIIVRIIFGILIVKVKLYIYII